MTRAKSSLHLVRPLRFFVRQQPRHGDRHVIAPLSRFLPDAIWDRFERITVHDPARPPGDGMPELAGAHLDVAARLRALWSATATPPARRLAPRESVARDAAGRRLPALPSSSLPGIHKAVGSE
jgi:hypothetical protein